MKKYFTEHLIENKKGERFNAKVYSAVKYGHDIRADLFQGDKYIKTIKIATMSNTYKVIEHNIGKE